MSISGFDCSVLTLFSLFAEHPAAIELAYSKGSGPVLVIEEDDDINIMDEDEGAIPQEAETMMPPKKVNAQTLSSGRAEGGLPPSAHKASHSKGISKRILSHAGSSKTSRGDGPLSGRHTNSGGVMDEDCNSSLGRGGRRFSNPSALGQGKPRNDAPMEGDLSQVSNFEVWLLFEGLKCYAVPSLSFEVLGLRNVQVPDFWKYFHGTALNYEGIPVSTKNLFVPPCPMDKTRSYLCSPELSYGVASNLTTPVDQAFFNSVDKDVLEGSFMGYSTIVSPSKFSS